MTIRIIIADDHQLFREGIAALLSDDEDLAIVGQAANGHELLQLLESVQPHVVLIDLAMPGMDGFTAMEKSRKRYPKVKFIVLTMHEEGQYVTRAVRHGAFGFLLKNTDEEELKQAIHTVFRGKKYFNHRISALMISNISLEGTLPKPLSRRETEVLQKVAEGKTTKEIASELFVSTRTVETHRINMMKKLEVQNSAELIRKAAQMKII